MPIRMNSEADFWRHVRTRPAGECWIWGGSYNLRGYGQMSFNGRSRLAHRLAYQFAIGEIPAGLCVCHHCDVKGCVRPDHLFAGSHSDNMADMRSKGRQRYASGDNHGLRKHPERTARGERHSQHKLTERDVRKIRALAATGMVHRVIGERYGVTQGTISGIVRRDDWSHVA